MTTRTRPTGATGDEGQDKILTALAGLGQATARQIADQAGLGYSTVTARLRKLGRAGLIIQQPTGTGPAGWRLTGQAAQPEHPTGPAGTAPAQTGPQQAAPAAESAAHRHTTFPAAPPQAPPAGEHAGSAQAGQDGPTAAAPAAPGAKPHGSGQTQRREPGQLRQQVHSVLLKHADQRLTPHQISKLLGGASSGAILLAARKLVEQGSAKEVLERPATFQAD